MEIIKTSKRKRELIDNCDGREYVKKLFNEFLKQNIIRRHSRYTSGGTVFAEQFYRTMRNKLEKPVFERGNANWISELSSITKKCNNTIHHCNKMTPSEASKKVNKKIVYSNIQDKSH